MFAAFLPAASTLSWKHRLTIVAGVFLGIGLTALICGALRIEFSQKLWLMAPLGATAAQVFSVPTSPMSQPWPVVAGHALSALAGLVAVHLFGATSLGCAVAVALCVALMLQFRAMHPSGGGTALFVVISHTTDWGFILFPVVTNAIVLTAAAIAWHRLTGTTYPSLQRIAPAPHTLALHRFVPDDLEAALQGQVLDISRDDIERLIERTEIHAYRRMAAGLTCGTIMTRKLHTIGMTMNVRTAEKLMQRHDINALPVTDTGGRVLGLLRSEDARTAGAEKTAGDVMMTDYFHRKPEAPIADLVDLFSPGDRRYVVVTDADERLAGLIARSDLMRALFHAAA